jgi:predicted ATPase
MRLSALYIHEHEYLFGKNNPQTINFGGEYLYDFELMGKDLKVSIVKNKQFIPDFYNVVDSKTKVELVSAIVGENGVGKSSILDCIRAIFIKYSYSLPYRDLTAIIEDNGEIKVLNSEYNVYLNDVKLQRIDKDDIQTVYYSPHLDLKYNENFDEVDLYDISLDQFTKTDLENITEKGSNENGWDFPLHEELLFKNSLRQIEFLISDLFKKNEILATFNLPKYENASIIFRNIAVKDDYWNVPRQFVSIIKKIKEKASDEIEKWTTIRRFDKSGKRVENQIDVNRYILRRFIITSILSIIQRMMDEKNTFLSEGLIEDEDFFKNDNLTAEQLFLGFVQKAYTNLGGVRNKIFKEGVYESFFDEITGIIDEEQDESNVTNQRIKVKVEKVENILKLHRNMVKEFFNYYPQYETGNKKNNNLYEFLSFRPLERNLSSGENAMLNFFSKLYTFLEEELNSKSNRQIYILLLDEADLGFHPIWKKKYFNTILNTIPLFFDLLNSKPKLQIIFATHDPLTLSDISNNSVIYIKKKGLEVKILKESDNERPNKTFGVNIHELLADSFFVDDGLMGDFAKEKIKNLISFLTFDTASSDEDKPIGTWDENSAQQLIEIVGEPVIQQRLQSLFDVKFNISEKEALESKINELQQKLKELNEKNSDR